MQESFWRTETEEQQLLKSRDEQKQEHFCSCPIQFRICAQGGSKWKPLSKSVVHSLAPFCPGDSVLERPRVTMSLGDLGHSEYRR